MATAEAPLHLIKLCVGAETVSDLRRFVAGRVTARAARGLSAASEHETRLRPKRMDEILAGGSLYWVIKGVTQARQQIIGAESVDGPDGAPRCRLLLAPEVVLVRGQPRRPFQGWRYLTDDAAPPDLSSVSAAAKNRGGEREAALPPALSAALAEVGVLA